MREREREREREKRNKKHCSQDIRITIRNGEKEKQN